MTKISLAFLGTVPPDSYYLTKLIRLGGQQGLLIRRDGIWVSPDGGRHWKATVKIGESNVLPSFDAAIAINSEHFLALSGGELFDSLDGGHTWKRNNPESESKDEFLAIAGDADGVWAAVGGSRSVPIPPREFTSTPHYALDAGSSSQSPRKLIPLIITALNSVGGWQSVSFPNEIGPIDEIVVQANTAVAVGPYVALVSTNRGKSWSELQWNLLANEENTYPVSAAIFGERIWVSLKNGGLLGGSVHGRELSRISNASSPLGPLIFTSPKAGFALEEDDLVRTEDGGVTWIRLTHSKNVRALANTQSGIFGVAYDRFFRIDVTGEAHLSLPPRFLTLEQKPSY